ncbi:MAG: Rab family GTPase [Promethearchaeota archaeon]
MKKNLIYPFDDLLVKGCIFSIYGDMGPEAVFFYPIPNDSSFNFPEMENHSSTFDQRNFMQIAVKSISLLLVDYSFENEGNIHLEDVHIFGVLPYPDISCIALTYFTYFFSEAKKRFIPVSLSLLVHENKRSFIYDSINRLRGPTKKFTKYLIDLCKSKNIYSELDGQNYWEIVLSKFTDFFKEIQKIQNQPISPITKKRRIKILFTGLENTGKTSFILTVKRKFSGLPTILPSTEPINEPLNFLGTTIMKWDIPGQKDLREAILENSELYLFESDVIYYFIDVMNPRIEESTEFLSKVMEKILEYESTIPIIFIITKVDEDVAGNIEIKDAIGEIKESHLKIIGDHPYKFFTTSIFSIYSVLNAFSYGLRNLSPNREMIEHLLWGFLARNEFITGLLVNENGLVLASQQVNVKNPDDILNRKQIFEIAAPQFAIISKQFKDFNKNPSDTTKYQFSEKELVILKRFNVEDFTFFYIFYTKKPESVKNLEKNFPEFLNRIKNLLLLYIR